MDAVNHLLSENIAFCVVSPSVPCSSYRAWGQEAPWHLAAPARLDTRSSFVRASYLSVVEDLFAQRGYEVAERLRRARRQFVMRVNVRAHT